MGDSLDDGFEAYEMEQDYEEDEVDEEEGMMEAPITSSTKKRKHDDAGTDDAAKVTDNSKKKKKKKQQQKEGKQIDDDNDEEKGDMNKEADKKASKVGNEAKDKMTTQPQHLPVEKQADFVWSTYSKLMGLSPLEMDQASIQSCHLVAPKKKKKKKDKKKQQQQQQQHGDGNTTLNLASTALTDFLKQALPSLGSLASDKKNRVPGSPFVIIISSSAVRSNELAKELRITMKSYKTAKLFTKHLNVSEQVEILKEYQALACGTPHRLSQLLEMKALNLSATRLIILDMARDSKKYHLLNLPGVANDTASLLKTSIFPELGKKGNQMKLALF